MPGELDRKTKNIYRAQKESINEASEAAWGSTVQVLLRLHHFHFLFHVLLLVVLLLFLILFPQRMRARKERAEQRATAALQVKFLEKGTTQAKSKMDV